MSLTIFKDPSIQYVDNITWSKVTELKTIPTLLLNDGLHPSYVPQENLRQIKDKAIIDLTNRLNNLQDDLARYNPSLIQRIINFFTGHLFTLCRLRSNLADIINSISGISKKILSNQAKTKAKNDADASKKTADAAARKIQHDAALKQQAEDEKIRLREQRQEQIRKRAAEAARIKKLQEDAEAAKQAAAQAAAAAQLAAQQLANAHAAAQAAAKQNVPPTPSSGLAAIASASSAANAASAKALAAANAASAAAKAAVAAQSSYMVQLEQLDVQDEDAIKRGDEIRVNESNLPITPEELENKKAFVWKVKKTIEQYLCTYKQGSANGNNETDNHTPQYTEQTVVKVHKFFRSMLIKLARNINVPVPRWYHATGRHGDAFVAVEAILKSKHLWQLGAPRGYGTYFSSIDEHLGGYGDHTFLFDEGTFQQSELDSTPSKHSVSKNKKEIEVHYFPGDRPAQTSQADRNTALWIRVRNITPEFRDSIRNRGGSDMSGAQENCVPVNTNTVAFMATTATHVPALRKKLAELNFPVSVLTREEVDFIRSCIDSVETQRSSISTFPRDKLTQHDLTTDHRDQVTKKQSPLYKLKANGQLLSVGGRPIPASWQLQEHRENVTYGFPRNMQQLAYIANNPGVKLTASYQKVTDEEILEACLSS